jgi:hypothetical protein
LPNVESAGSKVGGGRRQFRVRQAQQDED